VISGFKRHKQLLSVRMLAHAAPTHNPGLDMLAQVEQSHWPKTLTTSSAASSGGSSLFKLH
jgi:hypothetical protein